MPCPKCGFVATDKSTDCPKCKNLAERAIRESAKQAQVAGVVTFIVILGICVAFIGTGIYRGIKLGSGVGRDADGNPLPKTASAPPAKPVFSAESDAIEAKRRDLHLNVQYRVSNREGYFVISNLDSFDYPKAKMSFKAVYLDGSAPQDDVANSNFYMLKNVDIPANTTIHVEAIRFNEAHGQQYYATIYKPRGLLVSVNDDDESAAWWGSDQFSFDQ